MKFSTGRAVYRPPRPGGCGIRPDLDRLSSRSYDTRTVRREARLAASIEILYLRFPVHPSITVIQIGPGIQRIDKEGDSYFVVGTDDGPLAGKKVEIPGDNVAAIQWTLDEPAIKTS
jgi:hypothetical protein